jgi:hypothetical protein
MDRFYSEGFLPISLYASENAARVLSQVLMPWVKSAKSGTSPHKNSADEISKLLGDKATDDGSENCAETNSLVTKMLDRVPELDKPLSSTGDKDIFLWVGGFQHTLEDYQTIQSAEGSDTLNSKGQSSVLALSSEYRTVLNSYRYGGVKGVLAPIVIAGAEPIADKGYFSALWNTPKAIRETFRASRDTLKAPVHLKNILKFPAPELTRILSQHKTSPSNATENALRKFITNHCKQSNEHWTEGAGDSRKVEENSSKPEH